MVVDFLVFGGRRAAPGVVVVSGMALNEVLMERGAVTGHPVGFHCGPCFPYPAHGSAKNTHFKV